MYKILHLEKSDLIKAIVKETLSGLYAKYIPVNSTKEGLEILKETEVNLIITSLSVDNSIKDFIEKINKTINKDTPIFVVSGSDLGEKRKEILNLGVTDYIPKAKLKDELVKHIEVMMNQSLVDEVLKESKVAIVDDSKFDGEYIKNILTNYGIKDVTLFSSGSELFENGQEYDVFLVDMVLENEFGKNIVMKIRRNNVNSTIIAISSLDNSKTLASVLNAGANDYVVKPFINEVLIARLKSHARTRAILKRIMELFE